VATVSVSVSLAHYEEALEAAAQVAVRRWAAADPPVPLDGLLGGAGGRVNEEELKLPAGPRD
jgi:hypothetical protein